MKVIFSLPIKELEILDFVLGLSLKDDVLTGANLGLPEDRFMAFVPSEDLRSCWSWH